MPEQGSESEDASLEEQAALQRQLAALNGFGRIALQQVGLSAYCGIEQALAIPADDCAGWISVLWN